MNKELKERIIRYYDDLTIYSRKWESGVGTVIKKHAPTYPIDINDNIGSDYEYFVRSKIIEKADPTVSIRVIGKQDIADILPNGTGAMYYIRRNDDGMTLVIWDGTSVEPSMTPNPDKVMPFSKQRPILKMAAIDYRDIDEASANDDYWKVECDSAYHSIGALAADVMSTMLSIGGDNATAPYLFFVNMPNGKSVAEEFCEKENRTADMIDALNDEHDYSTNANSANKSYRYIETFDVRGMIDDSKYTIGMLSYVPKIKITVSKNQPLLSYNQRITDSYYYPVAMIDHAISFGTAAYRTDALKAYPELRFKLTAISPKIVTKYDNALSKLNESTETIPLSFAVSYKNAHAICIDDIIMCNLQKGTLSEGMTSTKMLNHISGMFGSDDVICINVGSYYCNSLYVNVKAIADERNSLSIVTDKHKYSRWDDNCVRALQVKRGRLTAIYDVGVDRILNALEKYSPDDALRLKLEYAVI